MAKTVRTRVNLSLKKIIILIFIFTTLIIIAQSVAAQRGHLKLLAVSEGPNGTLSGSIADLYLELELGEGRVFMDTFPLTKLDTLISTRFAKEFACDYLNVDCSDYDFIYTIRSNSAIIAGPSAGAAITLLTIAMLDDFKISDTTAITGTINSGGLIGKVGGVKEKTLAAAAEGMQRVLIPDSERYLQEGNVTIDMVELGKSIGVEVVPVVDIHEVVYQFSGKIHKQKHELIVDEQYQDTMKMLAEDLCSRTDELISRLQPIEENSTDHDLYKIAINSSEKGKRNFEKELYYTAASNCFGASVTLKQIEIKQFDDMTARYEAIRQKVDEEVEKISKMTDAYPIQTITDLETYMVVKERIKEAKDFFDKTQEQMFFNMSSDISYNLAFGTERINSALAWASFLGKDGKKFDFNNESLKKGCISKLEEAQERVEYVRLFLPTFTSKAEQNIGAAMMDMREENNVLCLFRAAKAKAETEMILNLIGVEEDQVGDLLDKKEKIVERQIAEQAANDMFPILGYSYFEYAKSMKESDPFSSLLYFEYALELSTLDMYFEKRPKLIKAVLFEKYSIFVLGLLIGILIGMVIAQRKKKRPNEDADNSKITKDKKVIRVKRWNVKKKTI